MHDRRSFLRQASLLVAGTQAGLLLPFEPATARAAAWLQANNGTSMSGVVAETASGKIRGTAVEDIRIFKGIPYGGPTSGKHRFMPPTKPAPWTGVRDALAYGPSAPQRNPGARPAQSSTSGQGLGKEDEDCLVLNVFTRGADAGRKRPVMVWLHGGGFATGSGSSPVYDGTNLARGGDVVVVTVNHRLNAFGYTYLGDLAGPEFALSGCAGMLDIVAALEWVRDNIGGFGGDPNLVTIFGESGGGRKVATLMAMPDAKGLFHRAVIESGAILRLPTREDATKETEMLLAEVGLKANQARDLQTIPAEQLLRGYYAAASKFTSSIPGTLTHSPTIDGKAVPGHPFDPTAPAVSADIPLLIGYNRTEETLFHRGNEIFDLDEAGLKQRVKTVIGGEPDRVIDVYRKAHPGTSPWDLYMLIGTDHPRGTYTRELARRKAILGRAPVYLYRFDWETPVGAPHMKTPHAIEIPFVFDNIGKSVATTGDAPDTRALAARVSAAWVAFARTGNPNTPQLPQWPAYAADSRDTMMLNHVSRVVKDPDREQRLIMEHVLKLA
jgi:para-nitrobenzyl esterase